jgi:3-phenylpropionate/trans-cinnamate dioxygenase ferredoxin reductase subunit
MPQTPWFWSDQHHVKLQIAGIPFDVDDVAIRGTSLDSKFAAFHLRGDRVIAVEAINSPGEFIAARKLISQEIPVSRERLVDPSIPMAGVIRQ